MVIVIVVVVAVMAGGGDDSSESPGAESSKSLVGPEGTITVPASENPLPPEQLWDPKELPDSVLDPMRFERSTTEVCDLRQNVKSCQWATPSWSEGGVYGGYVFASTQSFDELLQKRGWAPFEETNVKGQKAVRFSADGDFSRSCDIAWGTSFGSMWVTIRAIGKDDPNDPLNPCASAAGWAGKVYEYAPR
ncbi:DUF3558 family protein [Gordonia sp. CPCC 206044]|uniref:DUF3558 family protein n=1 Tax=Gordonia sp. CPCC 206044 TaxID=3140793 RepID=UPI003AF39E54